MQTELRSPIYVFAKAYPVNCKMSLGPSRCLGTRSWHSAAVSVTDLCQFIAFPLNWRMVQHHLSSIHKQNDTAEFLYDSQKMEIRNSSRSWFPGLGLWVFLAPFIVAVVRHLHTDPFSCVFWIPRSLCIKAMPKHLECQAAVSTRGTRYANIHITAHTWRTLPAAVEDAHSESL